MVKGFASESGRRVSCPGGFHMRHMRHKQLVTNRTAVIPVLLPCRYSSPSFSIFRCTLTTNSPENPNSISSPFCEHHLVFHSS
ncbi:1634c442-8342-439c-8693-3c455fc11979-CDS [Sclerotinia trifoliorum]|uniref:1634c442-8342-439c-8693-3c455fc11979-CDS n=1 Tax=Sclerotinia trifoliorum TaxID=28548 RepID=A0A8H2W0L7_9HELO|nr:1634c442-8342-439c-8693-3c455fc11979-CDS [Sclerotinia trifoliorum]